MFIVIDMNTIAAVYNTSHSLHYEFIHIKDWIDKKLGIFVYGGTTYKKELSKSRRYLRLVRLLKDAGKAIQILDVVVDKEEKEIIKKLKGNYLLQE